MQLNTLLCLLGTTGIVTAAAINLLASHDDLVSPQTNTGNQLFKRRNDWVRCDKRYNLATIEDCRQLINKLKGDTSRVTDSPRNMNHYSCYISWSTVNKHKKDWFGRAGQEILDECGKDVYTISGIRLKFDNTQTNVCLSNRPNDCK